MLDENGQAIETTYLHRKEWGVVFSWDHVLAFALFFFDPLQFCFQTLVSCQVSNDPVVHFGDAMSIKLGKG